MAGEQHEGAPRAIFNDKAEAAAALELLIRQAETFRRRMGGSALTASAQDILVPLAHRFEEVAGRITIDASELEAKEPFGGEESYWCVFRYFCVGEKTRGSIKNIAEIWDHLAKTFDMSQETEETLATCLEEWAIDIEADAHAKNIQGKFVVMGRGYVFYEKPEDAQVAKQRPTVRRPRASRQPEVALDMPPKLEEIQVKEIILEMLKSSNSALRQSFVIKEAMKQTELSHAEILPIIDNLAVQNRIFKFKPHGTAAYLAYHESHVLRERIEISETKAETSLKLDTDVALQMLRILTARGRKPGQKMATSQMVNSFIGPDSSRRIDVRTLNAVARMLQQKQLVVTDMGTPLSGKGKGRSRAKSRSVFRVGISSPEMLVRARDIRTVEQLEDYLSQYGNE